MIQIDKTEVFGWEAAIRGLRNPMNSWDKSDSGYVELEDYEKADTGDAFKYVIGLNDLKLMKTLSKAGPDHGKFLRMINVTFDITSMQPWWAEFDTYKVGSVRNSCSKMHKIHVKPFELADFSHEGCLEVDYAYDALLEVIEVCEKLRQDFNRTHEKKYWRALIELLPEGFNMRATVQLNYQVLKAMYNARKHHKLLEWHDFCAWCETLPYFKEICLGGDSDEQ
jgi:hypothetical protein